MNSTEIRNILLKEWAWQYSQKVGVPAMAPTPTRALTWNRSSTSEWVALIATHTMPCESKANAACRHQLLPPRSRHTLPNVDGKWNWLQSVTWSILPCSCECVVLCRTYMITTIVQSISMTFCLRHGLLTVSLRSVASHRKSWLTSRLPNIDRKWNWLNSVTKSI